MDSNNKKDLLHEMMTGMGQHSVDLQNLVGRGIASIDAADSQCNKLYYQQFKRLYTTSFFLSQQLKQLLTKKEDLLFQTNKLEKKSNDFKEESHGQNDNRKKRFRRTAQQIQRKYICQVQKCRKCYGSEGSLQQHIKLKHPQLYHSKSENESNNEDL